ncbi:hypothetical protein JOF56_010747 [Kibdelosporangium banguiense]|uniref:Orc1-like AAA ATPase domain-containing protein n=1 Tax=Kibdelosporangium banguiense TaxID=1365924 RepID=A0ABS4U134_9PSEU|nr:ATP-binding protein [Kibdelosporangium banguiense]MBP2330362.1 hypothetical protein [Kibdelosporangium banguiense]
MTTSVAIDLDELRLRASLLSHYELSWLGVGDEGSALFAESTRVLVDGVRHWALDDSVRRSIAAQATFDELRTAWELLDHRPSDDRQQAIDHAISGGTIRLNDLTPAELRALAWLSRWLGHHLSTDGDIDRRLGLDSLLEPLRGLVGDHFIGRNDILARLDAHLADPGGRPLLIHGIGGIGKSSLLSRHIINRAIQVPVCYLNFDQTALDPSAPATVVSALARQLSLQIDNGRFDVLIREAGWRLRTGDKQFHTSSRSESRGATHGELLRLLDVAVWDTRILLVLDTFEEVQRQSREVQESFAQFVRDLARRLPKLSVVLAGRSPAANLGFDIVEVPLLEPLEATVLLRSLLPFDLPPDEAERVVEAVRPSPLCIRLAAGILRKQPAPTAFRDIAVRLGAIEGELYHRLLGYIDNPEVRRLAHPGLTLRRVTPELIQQVLARPCHVPVPDRAAAEALFDELAREAMLVDRTPHELVHRKDVRQMMLPRLTADAPETVASIHRRAVAYYRRQQGPTARTEELYHRMMLGQKRATLEKHWDPAALAGLTPSIDELPPAAKAYLAAKAPNLGVSDEDLAAADITDRREHILRRARKLFQDREFHPALREIEQHRAATGDQSPALADMSIQLLEAANEFEHALHEALTAREQAANSGSPQDFYTMTFHVIRLNDQLGELHTAQEEAVKALRTTDSAPPTTEFWLIRLRLLVYSLRLARVGIEPEPFSVDQLVAEAVQLYDKIGARAVRNVHGLVRDLAAEVGEHEPRIMIAALRHIGLDERDTPEVLNAFNHPVELAANALDGKFGDRVADLLEAGVHSPTGLETLAEIYRFDADDAIAGAPDAELKSTPEEVLSLVRQTKVRMEGDPFSTSLEIARALHLHRTGRIAEALELYDVMLSRPREVPSPRAEVARTILLYRGAAQLDDGNIEGAVEDFTSAAAGAEPEPRARAYAYLGQAARITGDLPSALTWYDRSEEVLRVAGSAVPPFLPHERAKAFLAAGLGQEAASEINRVLPDLRAARAGVDVALAEHELAVAEFLQNDLSQAEVHAVSARRRFARRTIEPWASIAALTSIRIRVAQIVAGTRPLRRTIQNNAMELADRLSELGLHDESAVARLLAARVAIRRQALAEAEALIDAVPRLDFRTPIDCRMLLRLCRAELADAREDPDAVLTEAQQGFAELTSHPDRLGTLDFPAGVAMYGLELAQLAVDVALQQNNKSLFEALERLKEPVYRYDPKYAHDEFTELRTLSALRQRNILEGWAVDELDRRLADVRPQGQQPLQIPSRTAVTSQLGHHRLFVSFGTSRDKLFATVLNGPTIIVRFDPVHEVRQAATSLMDDLTVQALLPLIDDYELVISPTSELESIAWDALLSLRGRAVSVTPTAGMWLRAKETQQHRDV